MDRSGARNPTDRVLPPLGFGDRVARGRSRLSGSPPPLGSPHPVPAGFGWFHPSVHRQVPPWSLATLSWPSPYRGAPGLGSAHDDGSWRHPGSAQPPTPLVTPVVPGRGFWPASQRSSRRVAGAQVDGTESGENFGVWEGGCACGLIRPRVRPIRVRPGEREWSTSLDLPLA